MSWYCRNIPPPDGRDIALAILFYLGIVLVGFLGTLFIAGLFR